MVLYSLFRGGKRIAEIVVVNESKTDLCRIPQKIYDACFWARVFNRYVQVYRGEELIFNFPARKLEEPERHYGEYMAEYKKKYGDGLFLPVRLEK